MESKLRTFRAGLCVPCQDWKWQIGNVQIGNGQIGNGQIGNAQIGNAQIGNIKLGNAEIGRMEWPFSATALIAHPSWGGC